MDYTKKAEEIIRILPELKGSCKRHSVEKVSKGEWHMLGHLHMNNGSMMSGELAKYCGVTTARMAAMVKGTEEKGLVRREAVEGDRRKIRVVLTEQGKELVVDMYREAINVTAEYLEALGPEDTENLIRIVKKTKDMMQESDK